MNFRLTASILIVMIGLLAVVIFLRHQPAAPGGAAAHGLLFKASSSPVVGVSFKAPGKPVLRMQKRQSHWYIISPQKAWGRDFAIGELCDQITGLKYHFRVQIGSTSRYSAHALGLAPPRAVLELTRANGKKLTLRIGRTTVGGRLYVQTSDHKAAVVSRAWIHKLRLGESHFATKSLTRFHASAVESIALKDGSMTIRVVRHGTGWVIKSPMLVRANPTKVTNWLSNLQLLAAHRFANAGAAKITHASFQAIITFRAVPAPNLPPTTQPSVPAPLHIAFGRYTDLRHTFVYALSSQNPRLAIVRSATFAQLHHSLRHFQDLALTRAKLSRAKAVILHRSHAAPPLLPANLYLMHHNGMWQMGTTAIAWNGGKPLTARSAAIAALLEKITAIRAKSVMNTPAPTLMVHAIGSVTIDLPGHLHPKVITIGQPGKMGLSPVQVSGWRTVYMVSTDRLSPLLPGASSLRSHRVAMISPAAVNRIVVSQSGQRAALINTHGTWRLATAKTAAGHGAIAQTDVASLTSELSPIICHEWLAHAPAPHNAIQATIFFSAPKPAATEPAKMAKKVAPVELKGTLRIWWATAFKPVKGKKPPAKTVLYYATWSTPGQNAEDRKWVFRPGESLVSGVKQLLKDGRIGVTPAAAKGH